LKFIFPRFPRIGVVWKFGPQCFPIRLAASEHRVVDQQVAIHINFLKNAREILWQAYRQVLNCIAADFAHCVVEVLHIFAAGLQQ
jgi:hypothetical protein